MSRFRQLFVMHIFGSRPRGKEADQEFLDIVKENFFGSLEGHRIKLSYLRNLDWLDIDNIKIEIVGDYASHRSIFTFILDKHLKVKNLFIA